jgi:hypothetical protein
LLDKLAMTGTRVHDSTEFEPAPFMERFRALEPQYAALLAAAE